MTENLREDQTLLVSQKMRVGCIKDFFKTDWLRSPHIRIDRHSATIRNRVALNRIKGSTLLNPIYHSPTKRRALSSGYRNQGAVLGKGNVPYKFAFAQKEKKSPKIAIISRGKGKRITKEEKEAWLQ